MEVKVYSFCIGGSEGDGWKSGYDGSESIYSSCIGGSEGDGWKSRYGWKWECI